ncbi:MAG: phosphatidate cytidylyltransferase [Deltaproteobacteria bacterium]|nr:phosphatidate cytidylyltransferase [Deltaproteobacteria bacterium]
MWIRIAAGVGGLAVVLPALLFGGVLAVDLLCWALLVLGCLEYGRLAFPAAEAAARWTVLLGGIAVFAATVYPSGGILGSGLLLTLGVAAAFVVVMATRRDLAGALDRMGRIVLGLVYPGLFLAWVPLLRRLEPDTLGRDVVLLLLACIWLCDTGAYFVGRSLGRHRLAPRLSPKKTWEGAVGGLAASVATAVAFSRILALPWNDAWAVGIGGALCGAAIVGDLAESLLKRAVGVKDSGVFLPGHGGVLDRLDSVLFGAPILYLVLVVLG